jgi:glycosyltransferase involved in cell wall biosynthesis
VIRDVSDIKPVVSVIVPCYNHAPFLRQRLDSIFCQTFQDVEVIILDDCSTDESLSILQEFGNRPNVSLFANQQNVGTFAQWQKGIQAATGDIIWIAEDDDYCEPEFLETLLPFFNDAEIRLAYCNSHAVDDQGNVTRDLYINHYYENLPVKKWHQDYKNSLDIELNHGLAIKNTIPNVSAVLFRKLSITEELENRLRQHTCGGDWMLYLHVLKDGTIGHSGRTLNYHRRHAQSVVAKNLKSARDTIHDYYLVHKYVLINYDINLNAFEKMVDYVCKDLRQLFPGLTDNEFTDTYNHQELRQVWEKQNLPKY